MSRGLEYAVLFFAAHYLSKQDYGELEYYKKIIEVGSSIFAFGFPVLLISYTRRSESKDYFYLLSILYIFILAILSEFILQIFLLLFLVISFLYYSSYIFIFIHHH